MSNLDMAKEAEYLIRYVRKECDITEELQNLLNAYFDITVVIVDLKKEKGKRKLLQMLEKDHLCITCYLWDKIKKTLLGRK